MGVPKPIGTEIVAVDDWSAFDWDACRARSWVDGTLYQDGWLAGLRKPDNLLAIVADRLTDLADDEDFVCFAGTLPLLDGKFVPGAAWDLELALPDGRTLRHTYRAQKG